jgi:segregation and condensation protein A
MEADHSTLQGGSMEHPETFIVDEATDEVMRVHLDVFQGPFEVLLYLIKAQEIDIFDIPIAKITDQFLAFLELMREQSLEVTGDFLVMAATLIQIKSRMLIPAEAIAEEEEELDEDPRLELVEKLLEYRRYRDVADRLRFLEEAREAWFSRETKPHIDVSDDEEELLEVTLYDLTAAFRSVLRYFKQETPHIVNAEGHSVDEKIDFIKDRLAASGSIAWTDLLKECRDRVELVCCFLAILELCKANYIRARQSKAFDEIRLFPAEAVEQHSIAS